MERTSPFLQATMLAFVGLFVSAFAWGVLLYFAFFWFSEPIKRLPLPLWAILYIPPFFVALLSGLLTIRRARRS